jgi:hypothetical protein
MKDRIVKPIIMELSVTDTLMIIEGMDCLIKDNERHELDRTLAKRMKDRIMKEMYDNSIVIERGD